MPRTSSSGLYDPPCRRVTLFISSLAALLITSVAPEEIVSFGELP